MNVTPISNVQSGTGVLQQAQTASQASQQAQSSTAVSGTSSNVSNDSSSAVGPKMQNLTAKDAAKALQKMNQALVGGNLKVEFAPNAPANAVWINVVDKTTGKVIEQLPPTSIRKFLSGHSLQGLLVDQKS